MGIDVGDAGRRSAEAPPAASPWATGGGPTRAAVELTAFAAAALAGTVPLALGDPTRFVGLPGAVAALVAVSASIRLGVRSGLFVALLTGVVFVTLSGAVHDDLGPAERGAIAVPIWLAAAAVAGVAADRYRRRSRALLVQLIGERHEAEAARGALERVLESAPEIQREGPVTVVAEGVCVAALDTFGGDAAALWDAAPDGTLTMIARVPHSPTLPLGMVTHVRELDDLGSQLATRRVSFIPDVERSHPELWDRYARSAGTRSVLRIPIAGDESMRVLTITWEERVADPRAAVEGVAQRFADQAALALEQARRSELQAETSALHDRLEAALLPRVVVADPAVRVTTRYEPGEDRLLLGGDFLDAVELRDGRIAALVGDVAGHGPDAAAMGANLRAAWRALVLAGLPLPEVLRAMHEALVSGRSSSELFVTLCTVSVARDRASADVVCAGHPAPLRLDGSLCEIAVPPGPPLGVADDPHWSVRTVPLPPHWSVVLYTDGLVEGRAAPDSRERFGLERLLERLAEAVEVGGGVLDETGLVRLLDRVRAANGGNLADDVAVLVISTG
ncbi:MAG: Serine phosphatase RsbU, regulator of sigma subunit [uncultured Thermoleophilia bacterium]|uniref:Serine phosphatase RsbU, regulator of sigma subunit n=1 Tax=uncultured Thermoleophilia bacterium TaxID=1497501 RepID=A0A6J4TFZ0_9ACTN|nr:MAG: Serine phosphatase RsbU, regulator of sigma subunit [uncultured Thermoleophilia bacterium]